MDLPTIDRRPVARVRGAYRNRIEPVVRAFVASPKTVTRMALVIAALPALERVLSLPRLLRVLASPSKRDEHIPLGAAVEPVVASCRRFLDPLLGLRVGRFRDNCMTRSLVLFHFLRRASIPVSVHFGVARRGEDDLSGHCWLQLGDRPLGEDREALSRLCPMYRYPAT